MHSTIGWASFIGVSCLSTAILAAPFSFPNTPNVFPNIVPGSQELKNIEIQAHGILPDGAPPATPPSADSFKSLRLIAFNELAEVAFFTELVANITNNVDGYKFKDAKTKQSILTDLTAVLAQEELHALNANFALAHFNAGPIQPCKYNFGVTTFEQAIGLASTFTDVVLGTLPDIQTLFATDGDAGLIRGVGSVIGQEGEQNGLYRKLLKKTPSQLPFLTAGARDFAFSALNQNFIVPGSCNATNLASVGLNIFLPLTIVTQNIQPKSQNLEFSITIPAGFSTPSEWKGDYSGLSLTYVNQQNVPKAHPAQLVSINGNVITFQSVFPFDDATQGAAFGNGLTLALVTKTAGPFANVDAVAADTIFGPGLIEIN